MSDANEDLYIISSVGTKSLVGNLGYRAKGLALVDIQPVPGPKPPVIESVPEPPVMVPVPEPPVFILLCFGLIIL